MPGGIAGGTGDVAGEATVATGSVVPLFNSGADQPLTFSLSTDTSGLPALTSGGVAVTYAVVGNTLTASAGGHTVFTFALNGATGDWTFTLVDQLDHPTLNGQAGDDTENDLAINLSSILRATDFDGDTVAAAANALIVTVDDDTPQASQAQQTGTVDEDGVPGGIAGGTGDVAGEATVATGSVAPLFNSGADQPLTFSLSTDTSGLPALSSGGVSADLCGGRQPADRLGRRPPRVHLRAQRHDWRLDVHLGRPARPPVGERRERSDDQPQLDPARHRLRRRHGRRRRQRAGRSRSMTTRRRRSSRSTPFSPIMRLQR